MVDTKIFVLVGPTCVGKTALAEKLVEVIPNLRWVPTDTTRSRRLDEIGKDIPGHRFIAGGGLSPASHICIARIGRTYYGLNIDLFNEISTTWHTLLVLDEDGAQEVFEYFPSDVHIIGVAAPSRTAYWDRCAARCVTFGASYYPTKIVPDYLVVNDDLEMATGILSEWIKGIIRG